jgi:hypothetical protein
LVATTCGFGFCFGLHFIDDVLHLGRESGQLGMVRHHQGNLKRRGQGQLADGVEGRFVPFEGK